MQSHVAVFAFPFGTHAAPLLTLTRRLASATPDATFWFFSTAKSNTSLFGSSKSDPHHDNIRVHDLEDGIPEGYVFRGNPKEEIELFIKATPGNFERGLEEAELGGLERKTISCVLSDSFLWFAGDMAEQMGVPWVSFWTAGPCSLASHFFTDELRRTVGVGPDAIKGWENKTLDHIPGMSAVTVPDLPEGVVFGNMDSFFPLMLHRMAQALPHAAAVAINSFEELDPVIIRDMKSMFQKCLTVGPFSLLSAPPSDDKNGCLAWLDGKRASSVAYLSFGTVTTPPPQELEALAEGIEASGVPFIWSLKDNLKVHLPEGFLDRTRERGKVVPWTPQLSVLAHSAVGVFVTHCGWNSVMEGITGGVPMICRPFFGDQRLNRRFISDVWKIGVGVEDGVFTKNGTIRCLKLVLYEEEGRQMREKLGVLKEQAKHAVGPNGSSTQNFSILSKLVSGS